MPQPNSPPQTSSEGPKLLDQVRDKIRLRHHSIRTEQADTDWVRRFMEALNKSILDFSAPAIGKV